MGLLEEKRILITGGSRGIGAGVVRTAMQEGAEVAFLFHHSSDAADELSREMTSLHSGRRCIALQCDVTDTTAMREAVKAVTRDFGRIDALVNNAGITRDGALARMDVAFSRDTPEKVYVQNRIWDKRRDLIEWLDGGANFYVCGDMNAMAKDVRATLVRAYAEVKSLSPEAAEQTVAALERDKRYQQDVY